MHKHGHGDRGACRQLYRHESVRLELAFSYDVYHFPLLLPLSHFIPILSFTLFLVSFPPPSLCLPQALISLFSTCTPTPIFPVPEEGGELEWDQASVFHTVGHDTLVGREINLVGH